MALTFEHWNPETALRFKKFVPRKGIDGFLNIRIEDVEPGKLSASFEVTDDMITMIGNMHGGCLSACLLYTSPSPRDISGSRMPSSA